MSKMSELAMELDDQAMELGFESYEEAIAKGYEVDYEEGKLVNPYVLDREQEKAHEAWLEERDSVIESLNNAIYHNKRLNGGKGTYEAIVMQRAKDFIKGVKSE